MDALTLPQTRAIALLAAGCSYTETAEQVHVDRATLFRWRQEPAFAAELEREQAAIRTSLQDELFALVTAAIDALRTALESPSDAARLTAAKLVFERVLGKELVQPARPVGAETQEEIDTRVLNAISRAYRGDRLG